MFHMRARGRDWEKIYRDKCKYIDFFGLTQMESIKYWYMSFIKITYFCSLTNTKKIKCKLYTGKLCLKIIYLSSRGFVSRIDEELIKLNLKNPLIKN